MKKTITYKNRSAQIKVKLNHIVERGLNAKTYHLISVIALNGGLYKEERKAHSKEDIEEVIEEMGNNFIKDTDNQPVSKEEQLLYDLGFTYY